MAREMARMAKPGENGSSTYKGRSNLKRNSVSSTARITGLKCPFKTKSVGGIKRKRRRWRYSNFVYESTEDSGSI